MYVLPIGMSEDAKQKNNEQSDLLDCKKGVLHANNMGFSVHVRTTLAGWDAEGGVGPMQEGPLWTHTALGHA